MLAITPQTRIYEFLELVKHSLSETSFCLRRWQLLDADPPVRFPFHAVVDVSLTR
jgi:hypothetical protein